MCVLHIVLILTFESFFFSFLHFWGVNLDKYYTSVHPLSNTNLMYIYICSYCYMQIVLYCIVFYNNAFRSMLLLEINFILSYLI